MKKWIGRLVKAASMVSIVFLFSLLSIGYYHYHQITENEPMEQKVKKIRQEASFTKIEEIDNTFLKAIGAVEDHRFFKHGGMDGVNILRAFVQNIKSGKIVQGGSTISQQLAKNLYLSQQQTIWRKLEEMFIAYELEQRYTKKEILELYVNVIYYGDGNTGIKAASRNYFNKLPKDLNFHEATLLAGLPQSPSRFALSKHYERAKERQKLVVLMMEKETQNLLFENHLFTF